MSGSEKPSVPSVRVPAALPEGVSQATIGVRGGLLVQSRDVAPE